MKILNDREIHLERELSDLDLFVLRFCKLLHEFEQYVIVSGYVAILFGRSRGTEDIDLLIKKIDFKKFKELHAKLIKKGFWTLNSDSEEELFSMLQNGLAIRFAEKNKVIPNIELKFVKDNFDLLILSNKIKVSTKKGELYISPIDIQIAYKQFVLKSPKDIEDALHLKKLFSITDETIKRYKEVLKDYGRI